MEKEVNNKIEWYSNPGIIVNIAIGFIALIIILSQSFAINNNLSTVDILRSILNHNSIYLIVLVYFIILKTNSGRKYFNYLNLFLIGLYGITAVTSLLTVFQSFSLVSLCSLALHMILFIYMIHTFLRDTKVWKEFKLEKSPFNEISTDNYFYAIIVISVVLMVINLIEVPTFDGAILAMFDCLYYVLLSRFIFLFSIYVNNKKDNSIDLSFFNEVNSLKKDLPKMKSITNSASKQKLNGYQMFAVVTLCVCICLGIVFGNLFPACGSSSSIYSNVCTNTEFNFSLMIFIWFISFLLCLFFYAIGHIISLLTSINDKLSKR